MSNTTSAQDVKASQSPRTVYDVQRDLDLDEMLEDAVPPPSCEWQRKAEPEPCGKPATWILSLSCGHSFYYDDEHVKEMMNSTQSASVLRCSAPMPPTHTRFIPVNEIRFDRIAS